MATYGLGGKGIHLGLFSWSHCYPACNIMVHNLCYQEVPSVELGLIYCGGFEIDKEECKDVLQVKKVHNK